MAMIENYLKYFFYQILGTQNLVFKFKDVVCRLEKFHFFNPVCSAVLYLLIIEIGAPLQLPAK